jgi:hypothetical protein
MSSSLLTGKGSPGTPENICIKHIWSHIKWKCLPTEYFSELNIFYTSKHSNETVNILPKYLPERNLYKYNTGLDF